MKKILLTTAAIAILGASSVYANDNMFYVKANAGWSKLDKTKGLKSENDAYIGVAVGYSLMDNMRVDLAFDHFLDPKHKKSPVKVDGEINTLLVNGFIDVFDMDIAKFFVGAGVGSSQVKAKRKGDTVAANNGTAKQKYNLAFAGYLGAAYELTDGINGELVYSYREMGKTKKLNGDAFHYKGHHVGVGVRFDI